MTLESDLRELVRGVVREELARLRPSPEEYLSPAVAARIARVAASTIRRWIRQGRITGHKAGRAVRIRRADLESFLRSGGNAEIDLTPEQLADRDFG